jgi:exodeoxyribonuclease-5
MTQTPALSPEQASGIEEIKKWYQDAVDGMRGCFRLFGPAGTGKTTMAKAIPDALGTTARFMTYTGKAAHVLGRKGVEAKTIHSSIYYPVSNQEAKAKLEEKRQELAGLATVIPSSVVMSDDGVSNRGDVYPAEGEHADELRAEIQELEAQSRRLSWEWNPEAMSDMPGVLILDEVSMVNGKLAQDIEAYGIPVLVLGDPAQLPPVEGGGHYINGRPDFVLEEIHRQALESPVLELATRVRTSGDASLGLRQGDTVPASLAAAMEADQVIVWSNKRRWSMIDAMRRKAGRQAGVIEAGDRIMCLTNNKDLAVFNGGQFTVLAASPDKAGATLRLMDDDGYERTISVFADGFMGLDVEKQAKGSGAGIRGNRMLATFANAITCHKAQGSEWGTVYVVNELPSMMAMDARRVGVAGARVKAAQWLYTAVTRASDQVIVTNPPRS